MFRVLPMLTFALAFTPRVYITKCTSSTHFSVRDFSKAKSVQTFAKKLENRAAFTY